MSEMVTDLLTVMIHMKMSLFIKLLSKGTIQRNTYAVLVIMRMSNLMSLKDKKA